MEWNLVWNHTSDFKIGRARSAKSQAWFRNRIARHEVQLPLYYCHFEIAEFSQYQYFIDRVLSSSRFVEKRTRKGGYISFCIRNRNDLIWYRAKRGDLELKWCDLEQMWFRAKNSVICELITSLRANQIAGITSGFKMDIIKF